MFVEERTPGESQTVGYCSFLGSFLAPVGPPYKESTVCPRMLSGEGPGGPWGAEGPG